MKDILQHRPTIDQLATGIKRIPGGGAGSGDGTYDPDKDPTNQQPGPQSGSGK